MSMLLGLLPALILIAALGCMFNLAFMLIFMGTALLCLVLLGVVYWQSVTMQLMLSAVRCYICWMCSASPPPHALHRDRDSCR